MINEDWSVINHHWSKLTVSVLLGRCLAHLDDFCIEHWFLLMIMYSLAGPDFRSDIPSWSAGVLCSHMIHSPPLSFTEHQSVVDNSYRIISTVQSLSRGFQPSVREELHPKETPPISSHGKKKVKISQHNSCWYWFRQLFYECPLSLIWFIIFVWSSVFCSKHCLDRSACLCEWFRIFVLLTL